MLLQVKDITNNLKIESIKKKTFGEVFRKKTQWSYCCLFQSNCECHQKLETEKNIMKPFGLVT